MLNNLYYIFDSYTETMYAKHKYFLNRNSFSSFYRKHCIYISSLLSNSTFFKKINSIFPTITSGVYEYLNIRKFYLFYSTLLVVFILAGIFDIFGSNNSATSLLIYLLLIILALLLIVYVPVSISSNLSEMQDHLLNFSLSDDRFLGKISQVNAALIRLGINIKFSFFLIWKLFIISFLVALVAKVGDNKKYNNIFNSFLWDVDIEYPEFTHTLYWQNDIYTIR
jgi:hypothetical protein